MTSSQFVEVKEDNRQKIYDYTWSYAVKVRRLLIGLWLASDNFSDLIPILELFEKVYVIENNNNAFKAKRLFLSNHPNIAQKIELRRGELIKFVLNEATSKNLKFDVSWLDLVIHWCGRVVVELEAVKALTVKHGLIFLTVADISSAFRLSNEKPEEFGAIFYGPDKYKNILEDVKMLFPKAKMLSLPAPDYYSGDIKRNKIYTYGLRFGRRNNGRTNCNL